MAAILEKERYNALLELVSETICCVCRNTERDAECLFTGSDLNVGRRGPKPDSSLFFYRLPGGGCTEGEDRGCEARG